MAFTFDSLPKSAQSAIIRKIESRGVGAGLSAADIARKQFDSLPESAREEAGRILSVDKYEQRPFATMGLNLETANAENVKTAYGKLVTMFRQDKCPAAQDVAGEVFQRFSSSNTALTQDQNIDICRKKERESYVAEAGAKVRHATNSPAQAPAGFNPSPSMPAYQNPRAEYYWYFPQDFARPRDVKPSDQSYSVHESTTKSFSFGGSTFTRRSERSYESGSHKEHESHQVTSSSGPFGFIKNLFNKCIKSFGFDREDSSSIPQNQWSSEMPTHSQFQASHQMPAHSQFQGSHQMPTYSQFQGSHQMPAQVHFAIPSFSFIPVGYVHLAV